MLISIRNVRYYSSISLPQSVVDDGRAAKRAGCCQRALLPTRMSGARGVVAVQEAQWVAHLRRTLKEAVAETLHERPRPEKPSLRVVEHLQQMLFTPDGTTKEAASGLESEVRRLVQENQRLALAMERTEEQLKAGSDAAAKATLKIKTIGEAPEVVQGMEHRPARHAAHAAHVVRHATAELKHELAVAHARIAELEAAAPAPRASAAVAANWRLALAAKAKAPQQSDRASAATAEAAADQWTAMGWLLSMAPEASGVVDR